MARNYHSEIEGCLRYAPGWQVVLDKLQDLVDAHPELYLAQVKEKFGELRIYYSAPDSQIADLIDGLEEEGSKLCMDCGGPGEICGQGWVYNLCPACQEKRKRKREGHPLA